MTPKTPSRIFTALAFSLLLSFSYAQDNPKKYQSLLWEITGNGIDKPSYLYGTMHVSRKVAFHLTDTFFIGLNSADVIALETDPGEWMAEVMETEQNRGVNKMSTTRRNFYRSAFGIELPDNKDLMRAMSRDHTMLNGMLHRYSDRSGNFEEDTYLDLFIYQAGLKLGKSVHSLEDFKESNEMLEKAEKAARKEDKDNREAIRRFMRDGKNPREVLEDSYRNGDLDMLDSVSRMMNPSEGYQHWMIEVRNGVMADGMDSLMQAGKVIFTGVGAAHLPGEYGVIELLREKGYTVRPIEKKVTESSTKKRKDIMALIREVEFNPQVSDDSMFTMMVPGDLFNTPSRNTHREYFFPEMSNGAFYAVDRVSTFSPFVNQDPEYTMERLDSLLYENIPGEIIEKKRITLSGYPAFDITNKLKRGDYQRYHIVVTPMEILFFKVGATGEYIEKSNAAAQFYSGLNMRANDAQWRTHTTSAQEASVEMPGAVMSYEPPRFSSSYLVHQAQSYNPDTKTYFLFAKAHYHDFNFIEDDSFELRYFADEMADELNYKIAAYQETTFNGFPASTFKMTHEEFGEAEGKIVIRGPFYYLLLSKGSDNQRFFNSLKFNDIQYKNTPVVYEDTLLHFTVAAQHDQKKVTENYYYGYGSKEKNPFDSESQTHVYAVDNSHEGVAVRFNKFNRYYELDSIGQHWYFRGNNRDTENGIFVKETDTSYNNGMYYARRIYGDSASTRLVHQQLYIKHGAQWFLEANYDSIEGPSPFVKAFMNSFTPTDSLIGEDVFGKYAQEWFTHVMSEDSMERAFARDRVSWVDFTDDHAPDLIAFIDTFDFTAEKEHKDFREDMLQALLYLDHKDIEPFLTRTYLNAYNDAETQFLILRKLGHRHTEEAYALIKKLVSQDAPLTTRESQIEYMFNPYKDSLELSQTLFPEFFELIDYPEYQDEIYQLAAMLVDSGQMKPKAYKKYRATFLRAAKNELKRQIASESSDRTTYDRDYGRVGKNYQNNRKLTHLTTLLMPYRNKSDVKSFFDRLKTSNNKRLQLHYALISEKYDVPVADTMWHYLAKDYKLRTDLYEQLEQIGKIDLMPKEYRTQQAIAEALVLRKSFDLEEDTFSYIGRRKVTMGSETGWVYFFKTKEKEKDEWKLAYLGIMPEDEEKIELYPEMSEHRFRFTEEDELEEEMTDIVSQFRLYGRKRAGRSSGNDDYFYGLFD